MTNIWGILLQTIEVSLVAILLFIIKELFRDKLSPQWQYHVWGILFVTILIPVGIFGTYLIPQISILIEMVKTIVERQLNSSYIFSYEAINISSIIPIIKSYPTSITDYLFLIYVIGIIVIILNYFIQYTRFNHLVSHSQEANEIIQKQVDEIVKTYHLKPCNKIVIADTPSALIFGVFHPTLILPNKEIDDKILLHELYHLKYKDSLQSVIWSVLFTLHWLNPLMHFVLNQIKNDLEILCDQRVLEALAGEERRDYGRILLDMTNDLYPKAFASTSISNGTKQIKKRIESIVRFKKYPKQMVLLSICIAILLTPIAFGGIGTVTLSYDNKNEFSKEYSLASARLSHCSTMAGAIDTFVKGAITSNEVYLSAVLPTDKQENIQNEIKQLSIGDEYSRYESYRVKNIEKIDSFTYQAIILIGEQNHDENAVLVDSIYVLPIIITKNHGYKVELSGEIIQKQESLDNYFDGGIMDFIPSKTMIKDSEKGQIEIKYQSEYKIKQEPKKNDFFNLVSYELTSIEPNSSAEFEDSIFTTSYVYKSFEEYDVYNVGMASLAYQNKPNMDDFDDVVMGDVSGSSSNGLSFNFYSVNEDWDGIIKDSNLDSITSNIIDMNHPYDGHIIRIYHNYELFEEIIIESE